jgi:hypothetical protein
MLSLLKTWIYERLCSDDLRWPETPVSTKIGVQTLLGEVHIQSMSGTVRQQAHLTSLVYFLQNKEIRLKSALRFMYISIFCAIFTKNNNLK